MVLTDLMGLLHHLTAQIATSFVQTIVEIKPLCSYHIEIFGAGAAVGSPGHGCNGPDAPTFHQRHLEKDKTAKHMQSYECVLSKQTHMGVIN